MERTVLCSTAKSAGQCLLGVMTRIAVHRPYVSSGRQRTFAASGGVSFWLPELEQAPPNLAVGVVLSDGGGGRSSWLRLGTLTTPVLKHDTRNF
jgi:hypothetical protein